MGSLMREAVTFGPSPFPLWRQVRLALGPGLGIAVVAAIDFRYAAVGLFGGFVALYAAELPALRRLVTYVVLSAVLAAALLLGLLVGEHLALLLVAYAVVAVLAAAAEVLLSLSGPGPYLFVLAVGAGGLVGHSGGEAGPVLGYLGIGIAISFTLGLGELLVDPRLPRRSAADAAERAVAAFQAAIDRYEADPADVARLAAVDDAFAAASRTVRTALGLTADVRGSHGGSPGVARRVAATEDAMRSTVRRLTGLPDLPPGLAPGDARDPSVRHRLEAELGGPSVATIRLARIGVATIAASAAGAAMDPGHELWPAIAVVMAISFPTGSRALMHRAALRVVGTAVGIAFYAVLSPLDPSGAGSVTLILVLFSAAFFSSARNFMLSTAFVTAGLVELLIPLIGETHGFSIALDRWLDTAVGGGIALLCVWLIGPRLGGPLTRRSAERLGRAEERVLGDGVPDDARRRLRFDLEHAGGARIVCSDRELGRLEPELRAEHAAILTTAAVLAVSDGVRVRDAAERGRLILRDRDATPRA